MSVADQSAGQSEPAKLKRIQRPLTAAQWQLARVMFETGGRDITCAKVANAFNTSVSMVHKRSAAESWQKGLQIVQAIRNEAANAIQRSASVEARRAGELAGRQIAKELQPWIEAEKRAHIRRSIKRSKRALKRLDGVAKGYTVYDAKRGSTVDLKPDPKDEMHIATAEDKYDGIIRRNLGMSESTGLGGALSLRVLTGDVAIELSRGSE